VTPSESLIFARHHDIVKWLGESGDKGKSVGKGTGDLRHMIVVAAALQIRLNLAQAFCGCC